MQHGTVLRRQTGASNPKHNKNTKSIKGIWPKIELRFKDKTVRSRNQHSRTTQTGQYRPDNLRDVASPESEGEQIDTVHLGIPGRFWPQ